MARIWENFEERISPLIEDDNNAAASHIANSDNRLIQLTNYYTDVVTFVLMHLKIVGTVCEDINETWG